MTEIRIEWMSEASDCDQAGCSGGYAEGAKVYFDEKLVLDLSPSASCFDSVDYDKDEVFGRILGALGHILVECSYD